MFISEIIHNALIVLGELAAKRGRLGISPQEIALEHNIPEEIIEQVVVRLSDMGLVLIKNEQGSDAAYSSDALLHLAKHPDEVYVADVIKQFNKNRFNGTYIDENGNVLPKSNLSRCINRLRCRGEHFVETQMRGMSINMLATWSSLKKEDAIEQGV